MKSTATSMTTLTPITPSTSTSATTSHHGGQKNNSSKVRRPSAPAGKSTATSMTTLTPPITPSTSTSATTSHHGGRNDNSSKVRRTSAPATKSTATSLNTSTPSITPSTSTIATTSHHGGQKDKSLKRGPPSAVSGQVKRQRQTISVKKKAASMISSTKPKGTSIDLIPTSLFSYESTCSLEELRERASAFLNSQPSTEVTARTPSPSPPLSPMSTSPPPSPMSWSQPSSPRSPSPPPTLSTPSSPRSPSPPPSQLSPTHSPSPVQSRQLPGSRPPPQCRPPLRSRQPPQSRLPPPPSRRPLSSWPPQQSPLRSKSPLPTRQLSPVSQRSLSFSSLHQFNAENFMRLVTRVEVLEREHEQMEKWRSRIEKTISKPKASAAAKNWDEIQSRLIYSRLPSGEQHCEIRKEFLDTMNPFIPDHRDIARRLTNALFLEVERIGCNVRGCKADKMDEERMKAIKTGVFTLCPSGGDQRKYIWQRCVVAINDQNRNIERRLKKIAASN